MQYTIYCIKNKRKSECFITFTKSSYLIQNYVIKQIFLYEYKSIIESIE